MTTTTQNHYVAPDGEIIFDYDHSAVYFEEGYCGSVMECTDNNGNLSLRNAKKLCEDHGTTLEELLGDNVTLNGRDILEWLGY